MLKKFLEVVNINNFHTVKGYEMIKSTSTSLTSSMEDYLEMIYRCYLKDKYVRVNKVAQMLNVRDSSVSKMMKKLGAMSLIKYEKYELITLTEKGKVLGEYLLERHNIIEEFLNNLGGSKEILKETELIEHVISRNTVGCLKSLNEFLKCNPEVLKKYNMYKNMK